MAGEMLTEAIPTDIVGDMTDTTSKTVHVNNDISGLLGVLFIALKLTHVIDWSWVWVLAPFWIGLAFIGAFMLLFGGIAFLVVIIDAISTSRKRKKRMKDKPYNRTHW
jgi:hypothetical protein